MKCEECVYYPILKEILSSQLQALYPVQCTYCKFFPTDRTVYPDNFMSAIQTVTSPNTTAAGSGGVK